VNDRAPAGTLPVSQPVPTYIRDMSTVPRTHVYIIDGTMSRLVPGEETNTGLLYRLLEAMGPQRAQTVGYHPGVQGEGLGKWLSVAAGAGINLTIVEGYATLASRYRPGDRIMLFGFSRGAYAVRSLAGFIGRVGLVRREDATERNIRRAFRLYEAEAVTEAARAFRAAHCHPRVSIEVLGVWDTVKALGLPYPVVSRLAPMATEFHDEGLTSEVHNAFQALALDEDRLAYAPMPWRVSRDWPGRVEQMWFAGAHADVGGHVWDVPEARPLANISFRWLVSRAEACGLMLPVGWAGRFPVDPGAASKGNRSGRQRLFWDRAPRIVGACSSEEVHPSVVRRMRLVPGYHPRADHAEEILARVAADRIAAAREDYLKLPAKGVTRRMRARITRR
jgi:uncharacterized protein (DUF2235 family)